jgi:hypothetical protein
MLFSTTTNNVYSGASLVANSMLGDVWPYIILISGIVLGLFILEIIINSIRGNSQSTSQVSSTTTPAATTLDE